MTATILVIDDDETARETFARLLRPQGFEIRTAAGAEAGLREAELSLPDAIIVDLRMPVIDGMGFLRQLRARERQKQTPVAVVTGDYLLSDATIFEMLDLGAKLLFKPLWFDDLLGAVHTLVPATRRTTNGGP